MATFVAIVLALQLASHPAAAPAALHVQVERIHVQGVMEVPLARERRQESREFRVVRFLLRLSMDGRDRIDNVDCEGALRLGTSRALGHLMAIDGPDDAKRFDEPIEFELSLDPEAGGVAPDVLMRTVASGERVALAVALTRGRSAVAISGWVDVTERFERALRELK